MFQFSTILEISLKSLTMGNLFEIGLGKCITFLLIGKLHLDYFKVLHCLLSSIVSCIDNITLKIERHDFPKTEKQANNTEYAGKIAE